MDVQNFPLNFLGTFLSLSFWYYNYMHVRLFDIVLQLLDTFEKNSPFPLDNFYRPTFKLTDTFL